MYLTVDSNCAHWPGAEKSGPQREDLHDRSQDPVLHPGEVHCRELASAGRRRATKETWKSLIGKRGRRGVYAGIVLVFVFVLCGLRIYYFRPSQERQGLKMDLSRRTRSVVCIIFFLLVP